MTEPKTGNNGAIGQDKTGPSSVGAERENLIQVIWDSRRLVLLTSLLSLAAGLIYVTAATPIYTCTSRVYVEQSGPEILTEVKGVMTYSKNYLYTQAELMKSTPILSEALDKDGMRQFRIFDKVDDPIAYLKKKGLSVSVGTKDDIINVSCDSPDATEGALLVNAIVDSYKSYHAAHKRGTAAEVLRILQNEKLERDRELAEKFKAMMNLKSKNIALAFEDHNTNIVLDRLDTLSAEMTQAELQTAEAESVYETTKSILSDPVRLKQFVEGRRAAGAYIRTADEWSRLEREFEQLQVQLRDLNQQTEPDRAGAAALQKKIGRIQSKLDLLYKEFGDAHLAIAQQEFEAAKQRQEQVTRYFEKQQQEAVELNTQLAEYSVLKADWEQMKRLCDILGKRIEEINIAEDAVGLNISVLEVARPADKPSSPPKARYVAIALLLGIGLGGSLAVLRNCLDKRMSSLEEISAVLGLPILGGVPLMPIRQSVVAMGQKVHLDSMSCWAETYRTIRTAVFFGASKAKGRTILVTSPSVDDGKSTLASNLAIAMAQAGQKTLIVDADFRKPMQHRIFILNHEDNGLSSVIAGTKTLEETIKPTEIEGLEVLTCGPAVPNPSEVLNGQAFAKLLKLFARKYDRVIIDSPPVLPVTDAQILAANCQLTLLVLKAKRTTRKISRQARDKLLSVGANVLGVVVNGIPMKSHYGYYGSYGYKGRMSKTAAIRKESSASMKVSVSDSRKGPQCIEPERVADRISGGKKRPERKKSAAVTENSAGHRRSAELVPEIIDDKLGAKMETSANRRPALVTKASDECASWNKTELGRTGDDGSRGK